MAIEKNIIILTISDEELLQALRQAKNCDYLDNLRDRNPFVKLDSSIRGYLGEICFRRWLIEEGVQITSSNFVPDGQDIDIDLTLSNDNVNNIKLELKTSLVPDNWKDLKTVFLNGDIKIIKREQNFKDIIADFHVQIYYNQYTKKRDKNLERIKGLPEDYSEQELIEKMQLKVLKQAVVAWIDKKSLNSYLEKEEVKEWTFSNSMRWFWKCPLSIAKDAKLLPAAIKSYTGK